MGLKLCTSKHNYAKLDEPDAAVQPQRIDSAIIDSRSLIVQSYIFGVQQSLDEQYQFTYFEPWTKIPSRIHQTILSYVPRFQVYGIGLGLLNDFGLSSFTRLKAMECMLSHKSCIYKSNQKYLLQSCESDLFVIGHYDEDDSFISNSHTLFVSDLRKLHSLPPQSVHTVSNGLYSKRVAVKLKNGDIYLSSHASSIGTQCRQIVLQNITELACGEKHCLFLSSNGTVYALGDNSYGQCGARRGTLSLPYPQTIDGFVRRNTYITQMHCGAFHNACIDRNQRVWCFGANQYNQCSFSKHEHSFVDEPFCFGFFGETRKITKAECGRNCTVLLTKQRIVYMFGSLVAEKEDRSSMEEGRVSMSDEECVVAAKKFADVRFKDFSVGLDHMVLITMDGKLVTYGYNEYCQCGPKTTRETDANTSAQPQQCNVRVLAKDMFTGLQGQSSPYCVFAGVHNTIVAFC